MRKVFALMLTVLICVSLAGVAVAADVFTPSVTYKPAPGLAGAAAEGGCIVITSVQEARKKTTDITQEERDLLIEVYEKLEDGSMKVDGLDEAYVIRDLMDISYAYEGCRMKPEHGNKHLKLAEPGVTAELDLEVNIDKDVDVVVMTYIDGKWAPIESVENNGDGTLTCVFEDFCPVLVAVK